MNDALETLIALGNLTALQRERWIDHRIVGLSLGTVAQRDGVTRSAIQIAVEKADAHIHRHLQRCEAGELQRAA